MTNEQLQEFITKVKKKCPENNKSVSFYLTKLKSECSHVDEIFWDEAVKYYEDNDIFDKPLAYFRAILISKQQQHEKQKIKEIRALGTIPLP